MKDKDLEIRFRLFQCYLQASQPAQALGVLSEIRLDLIEQDKRNKAKGAALSAAKVKKSCSGVGDWRKHQIERLSAAKQEYEAMGMEMEGTPIEKGLKEAKQSIKRSSK